MGVKINFHVSFIQRILCVTELNCHASRGSVNITWKWFDMPKVTSNENANKSTNKFSDSGSMNII